MHAFSLYRIRRDILVVAFCLLPACASGWQVAEEEMDEGGRNLTASCASADYILTGLLKQCVSLGESYNRVSDKPFFFYQLKMVPDGNIFGDLKSDNQQAMKHAGRSLPANWSVSTLFSCEDDSFEIDEDTQCVFLIKRIKASAMAGSVPVTTLAVFPASQEVIDRVKELVEKRKQPGTSLSDDGKKQR